MAAELQHKKRTGHWVFFVHPLAAAAVVVLAVWALAQAAVDDDESDQSVPAPTIYLD